VQLLRTHKIGLHGSKPSHAYPIIRLQREFQGLVGSKVGIYQTVHEAALAFLVKVVEHATEKLSTGSNSKNELLNGEGRAFESTQTSILVFVNFRPAF
jgi:hypothetical protein